MAKNTKAGGDIERQKLSQASLEAVHSFQLQVEQSGPLPAPEVLARYEQSFPGSADRIIKMAESEMAHRQGLESASIVAQAKDLAAGRSEIRIGQIGALVITTVNFCCGTYAATHGAQAFGGILSGSTVIALVSAFLYRQRVAARSPVHVENPDKDISIPPMNVKP